MHKNILETNTKNLIKKIPKEVSYVTQTLESAGFEAHLVGGCVRDLLMDRSPKDWDVTTNATPEQIINLFEKTVYENTFGTVGVCIPLENDVIYETLEDDVPRETPNESKLDKVQAPEYMIIEVTPFRLEAKYTDFRHPDEIKFSDDIKDDLKRRDFTVNAMSFRVNTLVPENNSITDIFEGLKDIEDKVLRTVGAPDERFSEDALRMLRAVRFAVELDFTISHETGESILKNSELIKEISKERIRNEFVKIINSKNPSSGILMLQKFGLLKNIIPELEEGMGCMQSGEHVYDVWQHLLYALQHSADKNWPLFIRLSALFHDIGKPKSRREEKRIGKKKYTFYGHEVVSARMTKKIMERLKFPKKEIDIVEKLVRNHMFFSDTELITLSAVRRIIAKIGKEHIWDLMNLRECDRVGTNKKETSYRLRKYHAMIEEALRDPISVAQLKINGEYMMKELGIKAGPRMGWMLNALLEEVLDNPEKNTVEALSLRVKTLDKLDDKELKALGDKGKEKKEELEEKEISKLHKKHGIKR